MRNLRFYYRLTKTYLIKFKFIILLGLLFGLIVFLILNYILPKIIISKTVIGITGRYSPEELPRNITIKFARGLLKTDSSSQVVPDLAKEWSVSQDGKTWRFILNNDLYWNDGTKLTAYDLKYNINGVKTSYVDENIIEFELNEIYAPFTSILTRPVFKKGLVGIGEWKVKNIILSDDVIRQLILTKGNKQLIYKYFPTEEKTKTAFILGKINTISSIYNPLPFSKWNNVNIDKVEYLNQVVTIFFNTKDDLLSDKEFRQALNYAINKDAFNQTRAYTSIVPYSWAYNPQVKPYNYDPSKAKEIVESIKSDIKNIQLKIVSSPNLTSEAEIIKKYWQDIGVPTSIAVSSIPPNDYQVYLAVFDIPDDPDQYSYWHSTQTIYNWSKYSNPRIDKLLEDGRKQLNIEDRKKTYLDFQRFLSEDVPAIFLYHPVWYSITRR